MLTSSALLVETNGLEPVTYWKTGARHSAPVNRMGCGDTTGAGDALMAGILGHLIESPGHWNQALRERIRSAANHIRGNSSPLV